MTLTHAPGSVVRPQDPTIRLADLAVTEPERGQPPALHIGTSGSSRTALAVVLHLAALLFTAWLISRHLSAPHQFTSPSTGQLWAGLDLTLLASLSTTILLATHHRATWRTWAAISATMMVCDAWYSLSSTGLGPHGAAGCAALTIESVLALLLFLLSRSGRRSHAAAATPVTRTPAHTSFLPPERTTASGASR